MTQAQEVVQSAPQLERTLKLLGGQKTLRRKVRDSFEAHDLLSKGLPNQALFYLVEGLVLLNRPTILEKAVGVSVRTLQRKKDKPDQSLDQEQSGRTWRFAELLAAATQVFGSQEEAEKWFEQPAMGLNKERPIDLLSTPAGYEMVEAYLRQLEYGVYV
jgi:putative toxin-antitoxin system antitoxin component (TIGR02293 family)